MDLKGKLTQKVVGVPLYVWGGGAVVAAGGIFLYLKRKKAASATGPDAGSISYPPSSFSLGGGYGPPGGATATPAVTSPAPASVNTVLTSPGMAPTPAASPATVGANIVGGAQNILGMFTVQNPAGSTLKAALDSLNPLSGYYSYAPSATDLLTERPGGVTSTVAVVPGTDLDYTVRNVDTGSGAVVAPADRKQGERYDMYGRVIY